jgi:hypothetical protein
VEYPTASSLLLPVVRTSQPRNLFERAMRSVPRMRGCRFSSVRSSSSPAKLGPSSSRNAAWAGSIAIVRSSMPVASHRRSASLIE